eukprot:TRINITY_DN6429_c0_g1_i1.p1 TRINITY_DN6429_c0_g1~~TRINITY_DN6429_c0_g1_i1.p1  ORF type:complete len:780 (+),score=226.14 TRINITY_DN6429_c0_g1_i1:416-2755(+)
MTFGVIDQLSLKLTESRKMDESGYVSIHTNQKMGVSTLLDFLKIVFPEVVEDESQNSSSKTQGEEKTAIDFAKNYKVHVAEIQKEGNNNHNNLNLLYKKKENNERQLSLWCMTGQVAMNSLIKQAGVRNIVLTSGTLSPLDSWQFEFQLEFPVRLENLHVIKPSQIWVQTVSKGPMGGALNSSYKSRNSDEYKSELGNLIVNCARIVPHGLLVFFPSYGNMSQCLDFWKRPPNNGDRSIWERIVQLKQPVEEPKNSASFNEAMKDFYNKVKDKSHKGAVFFAVCRGKVSEGLDFSDDNGRAVIITGLPFPSTIDPKVTLKKNHLNAAIAESTKKNEKIPSLSGNQWYHQQASRAVNQSCGRIIRHIADYGAVILADERFARNENSSQLSSWLIPHVKTNNTFGEFHQSLAKFFQSAKAPAQQTPLTSASITNSALNSTSNSNSIKPPNNNNNQQNNNNAPNRNDTKTLGEKKPPYMAPLAPPSVKPKVVHPNEASQFSKDLKATLTPSEFEDFRERMKLGKKSLEAMAGIVTDIFWKYPQKEEFTTRFLAFIPKSKEPELLKILEAEKSRLEKSKKVALPANVAIQAKKPEVSSDPDDLLQYAKDCEMKNALRAKEESSRHKNKSIELLDDDSNDSAPFQFIQPKKARSGTSDKDIQKITEMRKPSSNESTKRVEYDLITGKPTKVSKKPKLIVANKLASSGEIQKEEKRIIEKEDDSPPVGPNQITCAVCREAPSNALAAKCGHICCSNCWTSLLNNRLECPVCRQLVRWKQLRNIHF